MFSLAKILTTSSLNYQCQVGNYPSSNIVQHRLHVWCPSTLVRAEGWHSGGILSLSYAAGAWLLGSRYPRTTADTSHVLGWAGLGWADNSAHGDTARADDALTAAPHPSHHSCSVQFILMLIHAIDCGVEPGQWTGLLHMFQSVSGCRVSSPTPPPPLHSVLIPPVRSSSQILRYLLQCSLSRYLHPDKIIIRRCWC